MKSKSGKWYKGVCYDKRNKKWKSTITVFCKKHFIGNYDSFAEAVTERRRIEKEKVFGKLSDGKYGNIDFIIRIIKKIDSNSNQYEEEYNNGLTVAIIATLGFNKNSKKYLNTVIYESILSFDGKADIELNNKFVSLINGTLFEHWFSGESLRDLVRETGHHILTISNSFYKTIYDLKKQLLQ